MSTAKKKTTGKPDKPKPPAKAYLVPVIEHTEWGADAINRVPLFTIVRDGESVEYDMPAAEHPGRLLEYLRYARSYGEQIAASWILEETIGTDGYSALCGEPTLDNDLLKRISARVIIVISGSAPDVDYSKKGAEPDPT